MIEQRLRGAGTSATDFEDPLVFKQKVLSRLRECPRMKTLPEVGQSTGGGDDDGDDSDDGGYDDDGEERQEKNGEKQEKGDEGDDAEDVLDAEHRGGGAEEKDEDVEGEDTQVHQNAQNGEDDHRSNANAITTTSAVWQLSTSHEAKIQGGQEDPLCDKGSMVGQHIPGSPHTTTASQGRSAELSSSASQDDVPGRLESHLRPPYDTFGLPTGSHLLNNLQSMRAAVSQQPVLLPAMQTESTQAEPRVDFRPQLGPADWTSSNMSRDQARHQAVEPHTTAENSLMDAQYAGGHQYLSNMNGSPAPDFGIADPAFGFLMDPQDVFDFTSMWECSVQSAWDSGSMSIHPTFQSQDLTFVTSPNLSCGLFDPSEATETQLEHPLEPLP